MKIVKQSFEILDKLSRQDILKKIELAGRTCYRSDEKITEESASNFVKKIVESGHLSVIEHVSISVKIITNRGCCYSDDTKILTENGFKYFHEIKPDEKIYTLDDDNNLILSDYIKLIDEEYYGNIINFKTTQIDLNVTPNHNMLVYDYNKRSESTKDWKFIEAGNLKNKRYKFLKSCSNFTGTILDTITIDECYINKGFGKQHLSKIEVDSKKFLKLLGIWVTDGSISFGKNGCCNRIFISQTKEKVRDIIRSLLIDLKLNFKEYSKVFRINCPQLFNFLVNNFIINSNARKTYYLKLPKWIKVLDKEELSNFIDGCLLGDGTESKDGRKCIYTASLNFAEDLVECFLKLGLSANINTPKRYKERADNRNIISKVPQYIVNVIRTQETLYNKNDKTFNISKYNGKVYCLELPKYHKLYVMRNGKSCWCGNSHELVRHRLASYSQESSRYCSYNKDKFNNELTFIDPEYPENLVGLYDLWEGAMRGCENIYLQMKEEGATNDYARGVLPNDLKTEIVITANLREWKHIFEMRCNKAAHYQIRNIMTSIKDEFHKLLPEVF